MSGDRPPPELVAVLRYEGEQPTVRLICFTAEDEERFRVWAYGNPAAVLDLAWAVLAFLSDLLDERGPK